MSIEEESIELHEKHRGKIATKVKVPLKDRHDLSMAYTPGVAEPCRRINKDQELVYRYTNIGNTVAVITDGTAVLGLGNIGAQAGLPVMEGKCLLFKEFGDVDAFPIALDTTDPKEIVEAVVHIAPSFGGINLEDISAPRCFEIESELKKRLKIPVFHDDQHGTAVVVLAALINALKLTGKDKNILKVVISGAGAAGVAVTKILLSYGIKDIIVMDSKGAIWRGREEYNSSKKELCEITNPENKKGSLADVIEGRDVFIGVSQPNILTDVMVKTMNPHPIIFAMSNPNPEINPHIAKQAGAAIVGTGRSDYPNQINNVLAFPGIFRGAFDANATCINEEMKLAAALALADYVKDLSHDNILPDPLDKNVGKAVAEAVKEAVIRTGVFRKK